MPISHGRASWVIAAWLCLVWVALPAFAQDIHLGRIEFENQCAVCHGPKGRGDGPLAGVLNQKVSDLSILKKNNKGKLPSQLIYEIIDGTRFVRAHGQRDMPIWGKRLNDQAGFFLGSGATSADKQKFVRQKIEALVGYIGKLQAD